MSGPVSYEEFVGALNAQAALMVGDGVGTFDGLRRHRQQRVELVGGGGDGQMVPIGHQAPLKDRFVARGEYDDGSGQERAVYVKQSRGLHPDAAPAVYYLFDGVPE